MGYARRRLVRRIINSDSPERLLRPKKPYELTFGETIGFLIGNTFNDLPATQSPHEPKETLPETEKE